MRRSGDSDSTWANLDMMLDDAGNLVFARFRGSPPDLAGPTFPRTGDLIVAELCSWGCRAAVHSSRAAAGAPSGPAVVRRGGLGGGSAKLLSDEHFTVDCTLIEAAASLKSFKPRDADPPPGRRRPGQPLGGLSWGPARQRHSSERDGPRGETLPEGQGEGGQADVHSPCADGEPKRPAGGLPVERSDGDGGAGCGSGAGGRGARTRGPSPDARRGQGLRHLGLRGAMRARVVTPHVAQNTSGRSSAIDGRTPRHRGYALSQRLRKRIEEVFGWMKTVGGFRRTRCRGLHRTGFAGYIVGIAYNLVRMARLMTAETPAPRPRNHGPRGCSSSHRP